MYSRCGSTRRRWPSWTELPSPARRSVAHRQQSGRRARVSGAKKRARRSPGVHRSGAHRVAECSSRHMSRRPAACFAFQPHVSRRPAAACDSPPTGASRSLIVCSPAPYSCSQRAFSFSHWESTHSWAESIIHSLPGANMCLNRFCRSRNFSTGSFLAGS